MPEARTFGRALDQAGNVGHHEALFRPDPHHPQIRMQGRERVVGDLRPRVRNRGDERRLAGVGHAEQPDVGQHFEFEQQLLLLAGPARSLLPRRSVRAGLEVQVAEPAVAALDDQHLLVGHQQFGDHLIRLEVGEDGPDGHAQRDVFGGGAVLIGTAPVFATPCLVAARESEVDQRVEVAVAHREHAAAAPAVATVRAAERQELLAPKTHAAVAALAGHDFDRGFVDKFHRDGPLDAEC